MNKMTADFVRSILHYDADTGQLTWKERPLDHFQHEAAAARWNGRYPGQRVGYRCNTGYLSVTIQGQKLLCHRVIWLIVHGHWPADQIDHINGDPADNRLVNLRHVTPQKNQRNRKLSKASTSGVSGVTWCRTRKRWMVRIGASANPTYLGCFKDKDEAVAARKAGEAALGYHKNHGRVRGVAA